MARIHIDNLAAGMVLKQSVFDRSGRMLLPEGATLEEKHFKIFRMWGVLEAEVTDEAEVEPAEPQPADQLDPALLAEALDEVKRLFVHNDPEHPAIRELMRICVERRATSAA